MVRIMMQKVKAYLWDNRIVYAVGIFLFVMGISTGVGFSRYIQEDIVVFRGFSVSAIGAMVQNGTEGFSLFFVAWFEALQVLLLLFFFGLGILGIPFCFFFIAVQGFKMGYTASVLLSLLGIKAVGIVFVLFFILGFVYWRMLYNMLQRELAGYKDQTSYDENKRIVADGGCQDSGLLWGRCVFCFSGSVVYSSA